MKKLLIVFSLCLSLNLFAQEEYFEQGSSEIGLTNIGLGYSNVGGLAVSLSSRYQYYFLNRFAVGGFGFYNNFNDNEWMGVGPSASYILFTLNNWFGRLDQQVTFAKFNGFSDPDPASIYGTSGISINHMTPDSNFYIGFGYARTYALNEGRVIWPNSFQVFAGWFF